MLIHMPCNLGERYFAALLPCPLVSGSLAQELAILVGWAGIAVFALMMFGRDGRGAWRDHAGDRPAGDDGARCRRRERAESVSDGADLSRHRYHADAPDPEDILSCHRRWTGFRGKVNMTRS